MTALLAVLETRWFGGILVLVALVLLGLYLWKRRAANMFAWLLPAAAFALAGVGGLAVPSSWGVGLAIGGATLLALLLAVLIVSGVWWRPLGFVCAALIVLGRRRR